VDGSAAGSARPDWPAARHTLLVAALTTAAVAFASWLLADDYANTSVGLIFLGAAWWLVLRRNSSQIRAYGLSLGGLTEPRPLEVRRLVGDAARAVGWALLLAAVFFPPFWFGYAWWWRPAMPFVPALPADFASRVMGQLLVVALPEEAFYRGFLQSALDGRWAARRWHVLGAELGPGWLVACAIFAAGHVLTIPYPTRLAVFFPALLFGWLRSRTGGIGAPLVFHALCNLYTGLLATGFGLP